ncbi:MAG TPA: hypothetical protein VI895_10950 [Bdellovibrionota bacterium]|nr:hypothetical protein [Bdellovibrionota bacterium]
MTRVLFLSLALSLIASTALAQTSQPQSPEDFLAYHPFSGRLGIGSTVSPETFLLMGTVEGHLDRFFSFGPMLQLGLHRNTNLIVPTLSGRFTAPIYPLDRIKVSLQAGVGGLIRKENGFRTYDFDFETGMDLDVFVIKGLTAGLGWILNVSGDRVDRTVWSLYASAAYHF